MTTTTNATHEGHWWRVEVFDKFGNVVAWGICPDLGEALRIATQPDLATKRKR